MIVLVLPDIPAEDQLLARARAGDNAAVMEIYESYFDAVYQYIRLRVDDRMAAEDIASEVFVKLIEALRGRNAPRHSLRGWLFVAARNAVIDHYGASKRAPNVELQEWIAAPQDDQPEISFTRTLDSDRVRRAVQTLTPEHQEVLLLRFAQALNLQDTADIMGKSVSAIKSLQFRAVESLRRVLGGDNE